MPLVKRLKRRHPRGKVISPAAELRRDLGLNQTDFARLVGASARSVINWEAGRHPRGLSDQRLMGLRRMHRRLAQVIKPSAIGPWFLTPNRAFGGLKPLEVIERGETDRIWKMLYEL